MKYLVATTSLLFAVSSFAASNDQVGKEIYQQACANCHAPAFSKALKAPAAFDKNAWAPRIAAAKAEAQKNLANIKRLMII